MNIACVIVMFGGRKVGQWNSVEGLTYSLRYQSVSRPVAFANRSLVVTTILVSSSDLAVAVCEVR